MKFMADWEDLEGKTVAKVTDFNLIWAEPAAILTFTDNTWIGIVASAGGHTDEPTLKVSESYFDDTALKVSGVISAEECQKRMDRKRAEKERKLERDERLTYLRLRAKYAKKKGVGGDNVPKADK